MKDLKPPFEKVSREFDIARYKLGPACHDGFYSFSQYDNFTLHIKNRGLVDNIPTASVRLNDINAALVLHQYHDPKILHANWLADFDKLGIIRANTVPRW